jgi:hypothetical protein
VLGIINSSPIDVERVFKTILANTTRLCEASYGVDAANYRLPKLAVELMATAFRGRHHCGQEGSRVCVP